MSINQEMVTSNGEASHMQYDPTMLDEAHLMNAEYDAISAAYNNHAEDTFVDYAEREDPIVLREHNPRVFTTDTPASRDAREGRFIMEWYDPATQKNCAVVASGMSAMFTMMATVKTSFYVRDVTCWHVVYDANTDAYKRIPFNEVS